MSSAVAVLLSLMENEWEISRRERKKVQPSNNIMIFKEQA